MYSDVIICNIRNGMFGISYIKIPTYDCYSGKIKTGKLRGIINPHNIMDLVDMGAKKSNPDVSLTYSMDVNTISVQLSYKKDDVDEVIGMTLTPGMGHMDIEGKMKVIYGKMQFINNNMLRLTDRLESLTDRLENLEKKTGHYKWP